MTCTCKSTHMYNRTHALATFCMYLLRYTSILCKVGCIGRGLYQMSCTGRGLYEIGCTGKEFRKSELYRMGFQRMGCSWRCLWNDCTDGCFKILWRQQIGTADLPCKIILCRFYLIRFASFLSDFANFITSCYGYLNVEKSCLNLISPIIFFFHFTQTGLGKINLLKEVYASGKDN